VVSTNNQGSDIDTVFRSTNGGRTWTSLKDSAVLNDGGRTWALSGRSPPSPRRRPVRSPPTPTAACCCGPSARRTPDRSADNGATWSEAASSPKGAAPIGDPVDADPLLRLRHHDRHGVRRHRQRPDLHRAGHRGLITGDNEFQLTAVPGRTGDLWLSLKRNGLHRSTDAGATFAKVSNCHAAHTLGFGKAAKGALPTWRSAWSAPSEDPRVYGRVYVSTNGRGVQYGEPA
jgi:hypothetical protein